MDYFLKAKHWNIFILFFIVPLFFQGIIKFIFNLINVNGINQKIFLLNNLFIDQISNFFLIIILFTWIWSIVKVFKQKLSNKIIFKKKRFNFCIFFTPLYFFSISILISLFLDYGLIVPDSIKIILIIVIIPLHLFSLYAFYYIVYVLAKTIKTLELQREVLFRDFLTEFFLIIIFPIGIWILQPKINELYNKYK